VRSIYEAFLGAADNTFFHGHTYTANPLACAAAVATCGSCTSVTPWAGPRPVGSQLETLLSPIMTTTVFAEVRRVGR